ncbi:hypothetical protein CSUB01_04455 [Colletotrichum sublineola]|uniref:Uncharacterized protein n=1 Tax=Colletotrichum sublineola TaxID=1173701 RepID=A0A066X5I0_COLSU|nr:hypothetical protein CSUB01_04455 [Colletotrichum sublineola]
MGSANSHEIRQIVDEAVVALRSGRQQQQLFCHHRPSEVISLDEDDDGVLSNEDGDYATYSTDDVGVWEPGYDSASDGPTCGGDCCSDSGWSECCYETVECCVGGGIGRGRKLTYEKCSAKAKKEKTCKECEKKKICRKSRSEEMGLQNRQLPWSPNVPRHEGETFLRWRRLVRTLAVISGGGRATAYGQAQDNAETLGRGPERRG